MMIFSTCQSKIPLTVLSRIFTAQFNVANLQITIVTRWIRVKWRHRVNCGLRQRKSDKVESHLTDEKVVGNDGVGAGGWQLLIAGRSDESGCAENALTATGDVDQWSLKLNSELREKSISCMHVKCCCRLNNTWQRSEWMLLLAQRQVAATNQK